MALPEELLKKQALAKEEFSWFEPQTTPLFQEDLYTHIVENSGAGKGIVEVGCYTGGMTLILGHIASMLGWPLYVIDVHQPFLDQTKQAMEKFNPGAEATYCLGDLAAFTQQIMLQVRPNLIFIDASHEYHSALNDIKCIYKMNKMPYFAAFHDFGLKSLPTSSQEINVGRAIHESWGQDLSYKGAGVFAVERSPVNEYGHYFEAGLHEGIIVDLSKQVLSSHVEQ